MGLREQLDADLKDAMRAKDQRRLDTIRMVKAAMKHKETEPGAKGPLDDAGILAVVTSEVKKRKDAIAEFEKGGRADLAEQNQAEIAILQAYLPAQLSEAELDGLVAEAIAAAGAKGPKDMGSVMKLLQPKTAGRADGKAVSELVKKKLAALS